MGNILNRLTPKYLLLLLHVSPTVLIPLCYTLRNYDANYNREAFFGSTP